MALEPDADNHIVPDNSTEHTEEHPFCSANPLCSCHEDDEAIEQINQYVQDGLLTPDEATDFVPGKLL